MVVGGGRPTSARGTSSSSAASTSRRTVTLLPEQVKEMNEDLKTKQVHLQKQIKMGGAALHHNQEIIKAVETQRMRELTITAVTAEKKKLQALEAQLNRMQKRKEDLMRPKPSADSKSKQQRPGTAGARRQPFNKVQSGASRPKSAGVAPASYDADKLKIVELTAQIENESAKMQDLTRKVQEKKVSSTQTDAVDTFQQQMQEAQAAISMRGTEINQLDMQVQRLRDMLERADRENSQLEDRNHSLMMEREKQRDQLHALQTEVRKREARADSLLERTVAINEKLLQEEVEMLRKENEEIRKKAFAVGQQQEAVEETEAELSRLADAQRSLDGKRRSDLLAAKELEDKLTEARKQVQALQGERDDARRQLNSLKAQHAQITERMRVYTKDDGSGLDAESMAVSLGVMPGTDERDGSRAPVKVTQQDLDKLPTEEQDLRRRLRQLRAENAEAWADLQRVRKLVELQESINGTRTSMRTDGQKKIESQRQAAESRLTKVQSQVSALVASNERLRQRLQTSSLEGLRGDLLEREPVRDVFPSSSSAGHASIGSKGSSTDNVISVEVHSVTLLPESFARDEPTTLLMMDFFLHPTQASAPVTGWQYAPDWRRAFHIKTDSDFIRYIENEPISIDLVLARGTDYSFAGSASLPVAKLLESSGHVQSVLQIVSSSGRVMGEMKVALSIDKPVPGIVALSKAPKRVAMAVAPPEGVPKLGQDAILEVTVVSADNLPLAKDGSPPDAFVFFQLPFQEECGTSVQRGTHPRFDYRVEQPYAFTQDVAAAFAADMLMFGVFNDSDPDTDAFLGRGAVELASLLGRPTNSHTVKLSGPDGMPAGTLQVLLQWRVKSSEKVVQNPSHTPRAGTQTTPPVRTPTPPAQALSPSARTALEPRLVDDAASPEQDGGVISSTSAGRILEVSDVCPDIRVNVRSISMSRTVVADASVSSFFVVIVFPGESETACLRNRRSGRKPKTASELDFDFTQVWKLGGVPNDHARQRLAEALHDKRAADLDLKVCVYDEPVDPTEDFVYIGECTVNLMQMLNEQGDISGRQLQIVDDEVDPSQEDFKCGVAKVDVEAVAALRRVVEEFSSTY